MSRISLFIASLAAVAGVAVLPSTALGAQPERFHDQFLDVVEDVEVCGINVDVVAKGVFTDLVYFDEDGNFVRFLSMASGMTTFTADNGKSVVLQFAGQFSEVEPIVDEAAGTITFITSNKGLPEKIMTGGGPVLLRDAGVITFGNTFDLETGEFLGFEIVVNHGPHPEADSDFTLFCEVIAAALS